MSHLYPSEDFFFTDGTLRLDSPSYVQRPADETLWQLVGAGRFCYVLASRQMGKSSLMTRTDIRLRREGIQTVKIDLTQMGTTDVTAEQWYLGLVTWIKRQLKLKIDLEAWWAERGSLTIVQRFTDFLREVVLVQIDGPVVIFIDEIDTTLKLDFSDDFFAAIRA
ncbi:MAG: AAA-like domain-containing protein, partial [Anaerolineae bacterium]|nr:AAA-like domain-containing protein [Anaerolineae bacterium]